MTFEWFSSVGLASCDVGVDASLGKRSSLFGGDPVFPGVVAPGDVLAGVPGDLSPTDLTRRLLGGRGETGDLGARPFGALPPSVASEGEVTLDARPSVARVATPVSCPASCLLGVVASGDLASPLRTARGVTTDVGVVAWLVLVGVEGGGCGSMVSLAFESCGRRRLSSVGVRACNFITAICNFTWARFFFFFATVVYADDILLYVYAFGCI